jgi:hypothetical protein
MTSTHKSSNENAQVIGQVLFAFAHNINVEEMLPVLQKYDLVELYEDQWYPVETIVKFFKAISEQANAMFNLVSIGTKISTYCIVPPDLDAMPFSDFLGIIDTVYHMQHRGDVGQLIPHKVNAQHYTVTSATPYPDDFWYGIYYGWAQRLLPQGISIKVWYDEAAPRQDQGGKHTTVHIEWN